VLKLGDLFLIFIIITSHFFNALPALISRETFHEGTDKQLQYQCISNTDHDVRGNFPSVVPLPIHPDHIFLGLLPGQAVINPGLYVPVVDYYNRILLEYLSVL
jgi:hypothetical protein